LFFCAFLELKANEQVIGKRGTDSDGAAADNGIKLKRNLSSDLQKN